MTIALHDLRARALERGSDREFLDWIRRQPSCISGNFAEWVDGEGRNPACHVRRAAHAGTGYKPIYSAVPMTHEEHDDQSRRGEAYCLGVHSTKYPWTEAEAKEWFDRQVMIYLMRWIKEPSHL